jgi:hypothetical protein
VAPPDNVGGRYLQLPRQNAGLAQIDAMLLCGYPVGVKLPITTPPRWGVCYWLCGQTSTFDGVTFRAS